ncbi:MAG TPA: RodZ domain-containing protein [Candidatus Methylomirabilis sp.]|nr:RodZ domain-containing protein [Candidatus Methylomirabilis sp.]
MDEQDSIGQILRQRREERGLTIEQAAFQCKVPLRLLHALEADDYHLLPDALYLIRLLHDLAVFLRLDPAALEVEFRAAIRRPPRQTLAVAPPPPPPPTIPWKQVIWTLTAIVVVTPLVFITLSLTSKRAAERSAPAPGGEQRVGESPPVEGSGGMLADRFLAVKSEQNAASQVTPDATRRTPEPMGASGPSAQAGPAVASTGSPRPADSAGGLPGSTAQPPAVQPPPIPSAPASRRPPQRFVLTARALEPTWISVGTDGGKPRMVLLQMGQVAQFIGDEGFVVTLGNAGGVDLTLNGNPVPSLGKSGQLIRDVAIPAREKATASPGVAPPPDSR